MRSIAVREKPIHFSTPMVKAILAGTKSQTRRIVKPQPPDGGVLEGLANFPYGEVGDRLWVRETWRCNHVAGMRIEYRAGGACMEFEDWPKGVIPPYAMPTTPSQVRRTERQLDGERIPDAWRPSIHMPRWASRITLEIVGVKVERLASISGEDAVAEGFDGRGDFLAASYGIDEGDIPYGDDPFVWAIEFRRIEDARRGGGRGTR